MPAKTRRVLLMIETSKAYGRALLNGVSQYALARGDWSMYVEERALMDRQPAWMHQWRGEGIIFRSNSRGMVNAIRKTGLPAVDTNSHVIDHGFPLVYPDETITARLAVDHFLERGFRHFAFCAIERQRWVEWRRREYVTVLKERGHDCHTVEIRAEQRWAQQSRRLAEWIEKLPKPVAVLAANDVCGMRILDACRQADVAVPESVAVLGVDNDETLCHLTTPPLSSINLNVARIGFQAAALLDRMMRRSTRPGKPLWIEPLGVVARQSTDVLAIEDPSVIRAIRLIRQKACDGITVKEVAAIVGVSRRSLETHFTSTLGRTPKQEIMRVKINRAKSLLAETDLPITHIGNQMGYTSVNYFCTMFKRVVGVSPLKYRKRHCLITRV